MNHATAPLPIPRRQLLGSALASALGLGGVASARPAAAPALPFLGPATAAVARSGVFWLNGKPRRLVLMLGQLEDVPEGDDRPGSVYGHFFAVADGPAGEFALEDLDLPSYPCPGPVEIRDDPPEPEPEPEPEPAAPAIPVPGPLVADEDRREIEGALAELAEAVRDDFRDRPELVGYYLRKAAFWAYENNWNPGDEPEPDARHLRKQEAMYEAWHAIDGQLGWCADAQGRRYDTNRRDRAIVAIVEEAVGRLERG